MQNGYIDQSNVWILELQGVDRDVPAAVRLFAMLPFVEYAEPNYILYGAIAADDFWGEVSSWDPAINYQWGMEQII